MFHVRRVVAKRNYIAFYGRSLSSFIALAVDDFEISVFCARHLNDFIGVCSNLNRISSCLTSVSTRRLFKQVPCSEVTQ